MAFRPAGVHAVEHLGPVLRLGPAGPGVEGEDGVGAIILPGEQGGQLGLLDSGLQLGKALLHLWDQALILHLIAQLAQGHQVLPLVLAFLLAVDLAAQLLDPLLDLLGLLQVVPETIGGALRFQHLRLADGGLQAEGLVQIVQLGAQIIEFHLIFIELQHVRPLSFL